MPKRSCRSGPHVGVAQNGDFRTWGGGHADEVVKRNPLWGKPYKKPLYRRRRGAITMHRPQCDCRD
eukprot:3081288-Amphidinium_carterae.2